MTGLDDAAALADPAEVAKELARRELIGFTQYTFPQYHAGWFARHLASVLDQFLLDCVAGKSPRLMVYAPPRHGKSELISRRFPAYALGRFPYLDFIVTSYASTLAGRMSRDVARIVSGREYQQLFPGIQFPGKGVPNPDDKANTVEFRELVSHAGTYRAAGVGEGITGQGGDVFLIDDPVKDGRDARSPTIREAHWEWYTTTAYTRLQPGGGLGLVMTRWNADDLAGRLREAMEEDDGDSWHIVEFPAIAERDDEFRKEGEALDPDRYPLTRLLKIKRAVGPYAWSALYQQHPTIQGGSVFDVEWWQYYDPDAPPRIRWRRIYADTAQKTGERNDYSVFQVWGMGYDGNIYLLDQIRDKWTAPELLDHANDFWEKWNVTGPNLERTQVMKIEDKSSGTGLIQQLKVGDTRHGGKGAVPVEGIERHTDKVVRADSAAPQIRNGRVFIPRRAAWLHGYKQEFADFTKDDSHAHDDQIDPTCDAIQDMLGAAADLYYGAVAAKK
ncbi:MAG: phage terminase large subunit [Planctomycetota bacterium]|nr:phage terminase large subunit [Planctomycetota bacterium]